MAVCHTAAGLLSSLVKVDVKCSYTYILQEKLYELEAAKKMSTRPHLPCRSTQYCVCSCIRHPAGTRPALPPDQHLHPTSSTLQVYLHPQHYTLYTLNTTSCAGHHRIYWSLLLLITCRDQPPLHSAIPLLPHCKCFERELLSQVLLEVTLS